MERLLQIIEEDATLTAKEIATMLSKEEGDVKKMIEELEENGTILGRRTVIDWDKTDREYVSATIELKVSPQRDRGFDHIAEKICLYPEVQSVQLMSGSYDLQAEMGPRMDLTFNLLFWRIVVHHIAW